MKELFEKIAVVDDGSISFTLNSTNINERDLVLDLMLNFQNYDELGPEQIEWQIHCKGVRQHSLRLGPCYTWAYADETTDHPTKWHYSESYCNVSFRGENNNPSAVVALLCKTHFELAVDWIPFYKYFNMKHDLEGLIRDGYGLLAEAPIPLALAYKKVLEGFGIAVSLSEPRVRSYWDGVSHRDNRVPLKVFILEESYIVAEEFRAIQIKHTKL